MWAHLIDFCCFVIWADACTWWFSSFTGAKAPFLYRALEIRKMEITMLPEGCISHIISLTSPRDACRSSLVCSLFRSVVNSDVVWSKFLPHDYHQVLSNSALSSSMDSLSKKQLYFHLSHHPVLVDNGNMPGRFSEVAFLRPIRRLDIKGRIETNILSAKTTYAAYFVYKLQVGSFGFEDKPVELQVYFEGEEEVHRRAGGRSVFLGPPRNRLQPCQARGDGWKEVKMGEFFNDGGEDHGVVVFSLTGSDNYTFSTSLAVEGIELRPKATRE